MSALADKKRVASAEESAPLFSDYLEGALRAREAAFDERRSDQDRAANWNAYVAAYSRIHNFLLPDAEVGMEVADVLHRLAYSDAEERRRRGALDSDERAAVEALKGEVERAPGEADEKVYVWRKRTGRVHQAPEAELERVALAEAYGRGTDDLLAPDSTWRETGPLAWLGESPRERLVLSDRLRARRVWSDDPAGAARTASILTQPIQEDGDGRFVLTPDGERVTIPKLGPETAAEAVLARQDLFGDALWSEVGQGVWHRVRGEREGEDYDIPAVGGHVFDRVPNVTGDYERDRALLRDPAWVRAFLMARHGGAELAQAGVGTASFLFDIGAVQGVTAGGLGAVGKMAAKAGVTARATQALPAFTGFLARYAGAAAKGGTGAVGLKPSALPTIVGSTRGIADMVYYSALRNLLTGQGTVEEGVREGMTLGIGGEVAGRLARLSRVMVSKGWEVARAKQLAGEYFERGWKGWADRLLVPEALHGPGFKTVALVGKELRRRALQKEAPEAFVQNMETQAKYVAFRLGIYFRDRRRANLVGSLYDAFAVGSMFAGHAHAEEQARAQGRQLSTTDPRDWAAFLDGMVSPEAAVSGAIFAAGAAAHHGSVRIGPREYGARAVLQRNAAEREAIQRAAGSAREQIQAAQSLLSVMGDGFRAAAGKDPAGALTYVRRLLDVGSTAELVRHVRDITGRIEPLAGDPHDPSRVTATKLLEFQAEDPIWARELIRDIPMDQLRVLGDSLAVLPLETRQRAKDVTAWIQEEVAVREHMADALVQNGAAQTRAEALALSEQHVVARALRRRADLFAAPQAPEEVQAAMEAQAGAKLAEIPRSPLRALLQQTGITSPKHALAAVNKYLGKSYEKWEDVPLGDVTAAARRRAEVKDALGLVQARARERAAEIEARGERAVRGPGERAIQTAIEKSAALLATHPDYLGKSLREFTEAFWRPEDVGTRRALADRVAEAERLAGAAPVASSPAVPVLDPVPPPVERPKAEPPAPAVPVAPGPIHAAQPPPPPVQAARSPAELAALSLGAGMFRQTPGYTDTLVAAFQASQGGLSEATRDAWMRGAILARGGGKGSAGLAGAILSDPSRAERVRGELVRDGLARVEEIRPRLLELGLTEKQLKSPQARELLALIAVTRDVEAIVSPGGFVERPSALLSGIDDAIKRPGPLAGRLGVEKAVVETWLRGIREGVSTGLAASPKAERTLLLRLAETVARGQGLARGATSDPSDALGGDSPQGRAEAIWEALAGMPPPLRVASVGHRPESTRQAPDAAPPVALQPPPAALAQAGVRLRGVRSVLADLAVIRQVDVGGGRTVQSTESLQALDLPADEPENARVLRALVRGDPWLREAFSSAVRSDGLPAFETPEAAASSYESARAAASEAIAWTRDAMLGYAEKRWGAERAGLMRDALDGVAFRNAGEPLPIDLAERLELANMLDEHGRLRDGIEATLADSFWREFSNDPHAGEIQLFGGSDPLAILAAWNPFGVGRVADYEKGLLARAWGHFSPGGWLEGWRKHWRASAEHTRSERAVDSVLNTVWGKFINPIWKLVGLPERSPLFPEVQKLAARGYRLAALQQAKVRDDLILSADVLVADAIAAGVTHEEARILDRSIDIGGKWRFRSAEEFAKTWQLAPPRATALLSMLRRATDIYDRLGERMLLAGAISRDQWLTMRGKYRAWVQAETPEDALSRLRESVASGSVPGALSREMERSADPASPEMDGLLDLRAAMPFAARSEANRSWYLGVLNEILAGKGSVTEQEAMRWPASVRSAWAPVAIRGVNLGRKTGETKAEWAERIGGLSRPQIVVGSVLDALDAGIASKAAPDTPGKRALIDSLPTRWVPRSTLKELEVLFRRVDPTWADQESILAGTLSWWKQAKTVFNASHVALQFWNTPITSGLVSGVPMTAWARAVFSDSSPIGQGYRGIGAWHDWALGKGEFAGWGSKNQDRLKDHPRKAEILRADDLVGLIGGTHLSTSLADIGWGEYTTALAAPEGGPARPGADLLGDLEASVDGAMRRVQPWHIDFSEKIAKAFGSANPEEQAAGIRMLQQVYQLNELSMRLGSAIAIQRENPEADFGDVVRIAARGAGDYGAASPWLRDWTSRVRPLHEGRVLERAEETLRGARQIAGARGGLGTTEAGRLLTAGMRIAFQRPFLIYPSVMAPELARAVAFNPVRSAFVLGSVTAGLALLSAGLEEEEGDRDRMLQARSGSPSLPDAFTYATPSREAIDAFVDHFADEGFHGMVGPAGSSSVFLAWIRAHRDEWKDSLRAALYGANSISLSAGGRRGAVTRSLDFGEGLRPLSTGIDMLGAWRTATASASPALSFSRNVFLDSFQGFLAAKAWEVGRVVHAGLAGEAGKTRGEAFSTAVQGMASEFSGDFNPITAPLSDPYVRALEDFSLRGLSFQQAWAGVDDPSLRADSLARTVGNLALSTLFSAQETKTLPVTKRAEGGIPEKIGGLLESGMPHGAPIAEVQRQQQIIRKRLKEQTGLLVRDAYWRYSTLAAGVPVSLDAWIVDAFDIGRDVDQGGRLVAQPTSPIGAWARRQVDRGLREDLVLGIIEDYRKGAVFDDQRRTLVEAGYRARMDPSVVARLWGAAEAGGDGILARIHYDLIQRRDTGYVPDALAIYERERRKPVGGKGSNRAAYYRDLDAFFAPYLRRNLETPEGAGAARAFGAEAIDLAPADWLRAQPGVDEPILGDLLKMRGGE